MGNRKLQPGTIMHSNNYGDFEIIEFVNDGSGNSKYKIRFLNTGYITIASGSAVYGGRVKDKYSPEIASVGFVGDLPYKITDPLVFPLYRIWNDMLNRCYNITDRDYEYYGAIGIRVDPRWFNFSNFFYDVQMIQGYDMKLRYPDE